MEVPPPPILLPFTTEPEPTKWTYLLEISIQIVFPSVSIQRVYNKGRPFVGFKKSPREGSILQNAKNNSGKEKMQVSREGGFPEKARISNAQGSDRGTPSSYPTTITQKPTTSGIYKAPLRGQIFLLGFVPIITPFRISTWAGVT